MHKKRLLSAFFILLAMIGLQLPAAAKDLPSISIVLSSNARPYTHYAKSLENLLANNKDLASVAIIQHDQFGSINKNSIIVAVGYAAAKFITDKNLPNPVIYTLVSKEFYAEINGHKKNTSSIFINQPWQRQLRAIREVAPGIKKISLLFTRNTAYLVNGIRSVAQQNSLKLKAYKVDDANNLTKILNKALYSSDALYAIPDQDIFNRNTAQNILLTTYKHKKPLIAYSKNYVHSGALLSVFSSQEHYATQTHEFIIHAIQNNNKLPAASYPDYFDIEVNQNVARSLGIELNLNFQEIKKRIK